MNTNPLTTAIILGVLMIAFTACVEDETQRGDELQPITSVKNEAQLDQLFRQIAEIECTICESEKFYTGEQCIDMVMLDLRSDRANLLAGLESGRLEFNAEFYQCAIALARESRCTEVKTQCNGELYTPKVAEGGSCLSNRECLSLTCASEDEDSCGMGVCLGEPEVTPTTVAVMVGEACGYENNTNRICLGDAICEYDDSEMSICQAVTTVQLGASCDDDTVVCANSFCLPNRENDSEYTCQALRQAGEACDEYDSCAGSLYCHLDEGMTSGVCRARVASGAACRGSAEIKYSDNECPIGDICLNQVCTPVRFEGEACQLNEQCQGGGDMTCQGAICTKACN